MKNDKVPDDLATIESALKSARNVAYEGRRGGMMELYEEVMEGLEAVERVREAEDGRRSVGAA